MIGIRYRIVDGMARYWDQEDEELAEKILARFDFGSKLKNIKAPTDEANFSLYAPDYFTSTPYDSKLEWDVLTALACENFYVEGFIDGGWVSSRNILPDPEYGTFISNDEEVIP